MKTERTTSGPTRRHLLIRGAGLGMALVGGGLAPFAPRGGAAAM